MGIKRSGKTTLLKELLTPLPERLVVLDTLNELSSRGFVRGVDADEFQSTLLNQERYAVGIFPGDFERFAWVCEACAARRDITLAIDELDVWCPTTAHLPPQPLLNMSLTGGHYGQTLICITHRPVSIHHSILSQGILWVFPMFDANDRKTVMRHTTREGWPKGFDPVTLRTLRTNEQGHIKAVEVARITPTDVMVCAFDLESGELTRGELR